MLKLLIRVVLVSLALGLTACGGCGGGGDNNIPRCKEGDGTDTDGDGWEDACDNCPETENAEQADDDGDGVGNACDNCPAVGNADQADGDGDGAGDVCDVCPETSDEDQADQDSDGHGDACDNCPSVANEDQTDSDDDTVGDACDVCPEDPDEDQADADSDGIGDLCDNCIDAANADQADDDGDGVGNECDNCRMSENPEQSDLDGDGFGDVCDSCIPGGDVNYTDIYFEAATDNDQIEISDVAAGDFNGDGVGDFALLNFLGRDGVAFFRSNVDPVGDEEFFTRFATVQPGTGPASLVGLDANGDGFWEIATANQVDIAVARNNESGNRREFVVENDDVYAISGPITIRVADFQDDGDPDLYVLAAGPNRVTIFINDGEGEFDQSVDVTLPDLAGVTLHDFDVAQFDGAGNPDIVALGDDNLVQVVTDIGDDGSGSADTFTVSFTGTQDQAARRVVAGSIEQNDVWDLAFTAPRTPMPDSLNPEFAVFSNDGTGQFSPYYSEVLGTDPTTLLFEDISFNGYGDIYLGPYFYKHSETGMTYENGRVRLGEQTQPTQAMFTNVNENFGGELIAAEPLRIVVLTPSCD